MLISINTVKLNKHNNESLIKSDKGKVMEL